MVDWLLGRLTSPLDGFDFTSSMRRPPRRGRAVEELSFPAGVEHREKTNVYVTTGRGKRYSDGRVMVELAGAGGVTFEMYEEALPQLEASRWKKIAVELDEVFLGPESHR
jgi:hypothetical protein